MKPTPTGWPCFSPGIYYRDAAAMIDGLCSTFGLEVKLNVVGDDGRIEHSELVYGEGLIMVGEELFGDTQRFETDRRSPVAASWNTQNLMVLVDDAEAHCAIARAATAPMLAEPELHDYGPGYWADSSYGCLDPDDHLWRFTQRVRG